MPDFGFTQEQELFRNTVREFCDREVSPRSKEMDEKGHIPESMIKGMAKLGLLGITLPEEYGGSNADFTTAAIVAEEVARADVSCALAVFYLVDTGWSHILNRYGKAELKQAVLPKVTKGDAFVGIASTEPGGGSDLAAIKTTMRRDGGVWMMNGEKAFISGVTEAEKIGGGHVTLVKTDPSAGRKGLTLVYVPLKDATGISTTLFKNMGRTGISTGGITYNDAPIPEANVLGEVNRGFYYAMEGFNSARVLVAAACIGAAQKSLEIGMDYLKQRVTFGKPLAAHQGVQFQLADNYTRLEAARLLTYKAAWMVDEQGKGKPVERGAVSKAVAMAKLFAPLMAFDVINEAMTWHGAFGYTKECDLERAVRGVRSYTVGAEGAQNIMRVIVARELLGRDYMS